MNYLDIYRLLSKTNCGECGMQTCMAFALSIAKGEADIEECPYVEKGISERIRHDIDKKDWKSELIESLRREISDVDFEVIAHGIGAELVKGSLNIKCLGMEYHVDKSGKIFTQGHLNPWIEILLLHYIRTAGSSDLSGKWVSFSALKGGMVKEQSFARDCEEPLRQIIDKNIANFEKAVKFFDCAFAEGQSADRAWIINPLPKVPFLILYWKEDADFDSTIKILFDSTADEYLDVESLIFLGEGLGEMFKRIINRF